MRRFRLTCVVCILLAAALLAGCAQNGAGGNTDECPLPTLSPGGPDPYSEGSLDPLDPSDTGPGTDPTGPVDPTGPPEPTDPVDVEPEPSALELDLTAMLAELPGKWSVYVKNIDTGEGFCINDEPMVAASLIKLYVAGAYYSTDPRASDASRCSQVDAMINVSSNEACNSLISLLGFQSINAFIRDFGDEDSVLNRKMLEQNGQENYVTAKACGRILEQILAGKYVSPEASERLLQNLKDQARTGKIPAGVPKGIPTANKTGELTDTENDAAIVWSPGGTYVLCVLSTDLTDTASARKSIVEISRIVYEYFTPAE